jgi:hypothetical protein
VSRRRDDILASMRDNVRGLGEDLDALQGGLRGSAGVGRWVRDHPLVMVAAGVGIVLLLARGSRLARGIVAGAAGALAPTLAAQAARWLRDQTTAREEARTSG